MKNRIPMVNSLVKRELSGIILRKLDFGGIFVTITDVSTKEKMNESIVRVSVFPQEKSASVLKTLNWEHRRLQHELAEKIKLKPMPKIIFELDSQIEEE